MGISTNHGSLSEAERGTVIFITGPPRSGKTTTATLWALERQQPTLALDLDQAASILLHAGHPTEHLGADAANALASLASATVAAGPDCIVIGARLRAPPPEWANTWTAIDALDPITVVLMPSVEACLARNAADNTRPPFSEDYVRRQHAAGWEAWAEHPRAAVLDTSAMSPAHVIDAMERAVANIVERSRHPL